jgi:Uma2 family endonuclease
MVQSLKAPEVINPVPASVPVDILPLADIENIASDEPSADLFPPADIESDEPELESSLHLQQIILLISCLELLWRDRNDYFAAGNLSIYFKPEPNRPVEFRGPDFFVVLGTEKKERKSWVVYYEGGIYPHVIVEILSDSTAKVDRTTKKLLYQNVFRTPNYFWFDPYTLEFQGFHLVDGEYVALQPNAKGHLWSSQLQLFLGIHENKLRYFTGLGDLAPTAEEGWMQEQSRADLATQRADLETQRAEEASQRSLIEAQHAQMATQRAEEAIAYAEKLAAKLRELNIDPEQI